MKACAAMPWTKAFWAEAALPSVVFGPVLFCAFRWFAAICRAVAMCVSALVSVASGVGREFARCAARPFTRHYRAGPPSRPVAREEDVGRRVVGRVLTRLR